MTADTILLLTPEIVLVITATWIYVAGAFYDAPRAWRWFAAGAIAVAAATLWEQPHTALPAADALANDGLSYFIRWLALAAGILLLPVVSSRSHGDCPNFRGPSRENGTVPLRSGGRRENGTVPVRPESSPEQVGSMLLAVAGVMLVAQANGLVLLFVSLELISIPTYVLLYLGRDDAASQESAAKYFFLSILASAMLLYGFTLLYGATGTTRLDQAAARLLEPGAMHQGFLIFGKLSLVLIFAGLSFKVAAVPFHFYAPDVYQGTTHGNAAFLSVLPKAAGFVALVRLLIVTMPEVEGLAWRIALVIAVLTMTVGNAIALWQDNLRRLLAYSAIAHSGYMLIGLAVALATAPSGAVWDGVAALLFYLAVYAIATIGAFAAFEYLGREGQSLDSVDELAGLGRTRPAIAAVVAVFMFSLAGIPPMAGFWGKLLIFGSALSVDVPGLRTWFVGLAVVGVLNAAVAAYYYLRIVAVMYFRTPLATPKAEGGAGPLAAAVAAAVLVVAIGILPRPLAGESNRASPTRRAAQQLSIAVQGEERKGEERRSLDSPRFLH